MVATSYPADLTDWRGLFIRHLADAFGRHSELSLQLWAPPGERHPAVGNAATDGESEWLKELMAKGGIAHLLRSRSLHAVTTATSLLRHLRRTYQRTAPKTDVYHINWLQNAIPLPANGKPVLITALGTDMQLLRLPFVAAMLRRICRSRPVAVCPNADWMVGPLRSAFKGCAHVEFIPFGIDPRWYSLQRSITSESPKRWLVVSRLTRNKIGPLFEWSEAHFRNGPRELHLFGPMQEDLTVPEWVHYHGPATPDQLRDQWFPQACGLITLSRHAEGRPQVMLEAMAAGLPIIASTLPAHGDLLTHRETGWLCHEPADYGEALVQLEIPEINTAIGTRARLWVRDAVGTWDDCAARYSRLYRDLLNGGSR